MILILKSEEVSLKTQGLLHRFFINQYEQWCKICETQPPNIYHFAEILNFLTALASAIVRDHRNWLNNKRVNEKKGFSAAYHYYNQFNVLMADYVSAVYSFTVWIIFKDPIYWIKDLLKAGSRDRNWTKLVLSQIIFTIEVSKTKQ